MNMGLKFIYLWFISGMILCLYGPYSGWSSEHGESGHGKAPESKSKPKTKPKDQSKESNGHGESSKKNSKRKSRREKVEIGSHGEASTTSEAPAWHPKPCSVDRKQWNILQKGCEVSLGVGETATVYAEAAFRFEGDKTLLVSRGLLRMNVKSSWIVKTVFLAIQLDQGESLIVVTKDRTQIANLSPSTVNCWHPFLPQQKIKIPFLHYSEMSSYEQFLVPKPPRDIENSELVRILPDFHGKPAELEKTVTDEKVKWIRRPVLVHSDFEDNVDTDVVVKRDDGITFQILSKKTKEKVAATLALKNETEAKRAPASQSEAIKTKEAMSRSIIDRMAAGVVK